ncbi:DNA polymerase III subunit alpha [Bacillaceae bacterium SIJ1]|uniref:DNA polymerase III subunit alpha n=1 Tax=Litoribacterium kuwaitense TaxID=1398745 RepID=UPI0013ED355C|nr:DNA polymerase III subunit alpha [Litoribacterium kuwaitense]NGP45032.1 DNA polymerase III subunit alpha [Litoribacterium kuwaitense]
MRVEVDFADAPQETILLYAQSDKGYRQLLNIAHHVSKDRLSFAQLCEQCDDLFSVYPVQSQKIKAALEMGEVSFVQPVIRQWSEAFADRCLLGIDARSARYYENGLRQMMAESGVDVVALGDVRCIHQDDEEALRTVEAIRAGVPIDELPMMQGKYHLTSFEELQADFSHWPEALENTAIVVAACSGSYHFPEGRLPNYPVPVETNSRAYLEKACWSGLKKRYKAHHLAAEQRLQHELEVIFSTGFADYFLIVWDIVRFAKKRGIPVGPGRGSAAGSMVAYTLGITEVDPLAYGLLFERFLNPERLSMPDIDIDIADDRRDEVIHYIQRRFGAAHTAQIGTFGTFAAKAAIRDVAKAFGLSTRDIQRLSGWIHSSRRLQENAMTNDALRNWTNESERHQRIWKVACRIEGLPRHASVHAAGIVLNARPLLESVPLQQINDGLYVTQFDMNDLEQLGLLKMDFLGLRNLSLMERIKKRVADSRRVHSEMIPLEDSQALQLLAAGDTSGIFQFESAGMKKALQEVKPTCFLDAVAVSALYRPGPMKYIPLYAKRKKQQEKWEAPHPALDRILESTHGVIIYQEQVMAVAHELAGFSLGEADLLRRAISKKNRDEMAEAKVLFIQGCQSRGLTEQMAERVFGFIEQFAQYGFNKSHAVAYTMISMQLAYLKAHHPAAFYTELLASISGQTEKIRAYLQECKGKKLTVQPPFVNKAEAAYSCKEDTIYIGLTEVRQVGRQAVAAILEVRAEQPFQSLFDFAVRMPKKWVTRSTLEALIYAGAFDELHPNRASAIASIDPALEYAELVGDGDDGLGLIIPPPNMQPAEPLSLQEQLEGELDVLGYYISGHPMDAYEDALASEKATVLSEVKNSVYRYVSTGGIVQNMRAIKTKKGEPMSFIVLSDATAEIEAVIFPDVYSQLQPMLKEGKALFVEGELEWRKGERQLIIKNARPLTMQPQSSATLYLRIGTEERSSLSLLKELLLKHKGQVAVFLYYVDEKRWLRLPSYLNTNASEDLLAHLRHLIGSENVALQLNRLKEEE